MKKKKILFVTQHLACGGVEKALLNLIDRIDPEKYEIDLMLMRRKGVWEYKIPKHVNVFYVTRYLFRFFIFYECYRRHKTSSSSIFEKIYKKIKFGKKYDVAFDFYGYNALPVFITAYAVRADKKATWLHCTSMVNKDVTYSQNCYAEFDRVFGVSKACCDKFEKHFPQYAEKVRLLYNINQTSEIIEKSKENVELSPLFNIVTVGRMAEQKGYDVAVKAAACLKEKGYSFKWYFVGDGAERKNIESLISKNDLGDYIVIAGYTDNPYKYISRADIYVQPSRWEGYCLTILEARVLKKPIICSDLEVLKEQIHHGVNGLMFKNEDHVDLCARLESVISNEYSFVEDSTEEELSCVSEAEKIYEFIEGSVE